jgi:phosphonate transport system substrate-binding protein
MSSSTTNTNRTGPPYRSLAGIIAFSWFVLLLCTSAAGAEMNAPVKFSFSKSMFLDFNENDTRAAIKLHASVIGSAHGLIVSEAPAIFSSISEITASIAAGETDVISVTAPEFLAIPPELLSPRLMVATLAKTYSEEFLLLVRDDGGIKTLAELRGRRLIVYGSMRGLLSPVWLDVLLAREGLEEPVRFFGHIVFANKPVRTVLPVFFRQEDACIVTRQSYDVLSELNPQLKKQLRVLASSPHFVSQVTCFRASLPPETLNRIIKASLAAPDTVTGKQMLTIFQCDRIGEITSEELDPVRQLLADQARLRGGADTEKQQPRSLPKQ